MGGSHVSRIIAHLADDYSEPVRDPVWKHIGLSRGLKACSQCPEVQLLGGIKQLGPASLVYPGATHTRLSHSFGVFHLGKLIIQELLRKEPDLALTIEGVKAFLAATFLHDVGHFPYAHSLKELPLLPHETLSGELIRTGRLAEAIRDGVGTDPEFVAAIIDRRIPTALPEILMYRNILSGVLDPDKLDYLNRDAYFCGVPYGVQDTDFIISCLLPHPDGIGVEEKGLSSVEHILFSKYLMYRTVYWHRTVRSATAMIKKAVFSALSKGHLSPSDLYHKNDDEFFRCFLNSDMGEGVLVKAVAERRLYKLAFETPFDHNNPVHEALANLHARSDAEAELASRISGFCGTEVRSEEVIIDIPEQIDFEVELPILGSDGWKTFKECGSVFDSSVVAGFKRSLRKIRLFVSERIIDNSRDPRIMKDTGWMR